MARHLTILGILYLVSSAIYLLGAVVIATALSGVGLLTGDMGAFALLSGLGMLFAGFLVVLGLPGLITGWGLLKHQSWSRIAGFVLGGLNLFNFPVGTVLGGYTFWVLLQPETERLLSRGYRLPA